MRAAIVGERAPGTILFAANHQSWMDILLIGGATGASFVSKETVRKWPIAGWLATMVGTIYISNSDRKAAGAQADRIRRALHDGTSVAFFPEGKLNNGTMLPFRPALFGAVIPPVDHISVQPIALDYGTHSQELVWPSGTHAATNARAIFARPGAEDVTVHLLDPIPIDANSHRKDVAEQCEWAIATAIGQTVDYEPA
ncbi:1-acyl-sn-glycerol-3-phosphate acyltransferase [Parasphingopyxis algicola]|uniref:lysophospholipid acyltransferase family protein n=1 Tax=Parasphingopyxis algicola TaxID=2026624 RepID=UPI0015A28201|nr:lysophospholipid acyltransferase family protein [Parasphingopyxis algicola]QLC25165.1 1-acyl-sn-glycerol-3-phosphate acyltransferase [Parasphingopyxis algicola]